MCQECDDVAGKALKSVEKVIQAEKHSRALYPNYTPGQHAMRLSNTILETQAPLEDVNGQPALSASVVQCLALQYATVVQRLIALHEVAGIPLP